MENQIRLGVVGTGRIAHRFVQECGKVPGICLAAVYNPHAGRAECFVRECGLAETETFEDWEAFLAKVDAVYIAAPHDVHYEYAKAALGSGHHVLCEKPLCLVEKQAAELYRIAQERKLVLMEAVKTAYCPGFLGILELVESGEIGAVYDVEASFTKLWCANGREVWDQQCGGSFTELGSYALLPIVKLLGTDARMAYTWSSPAVTGVDAYTKVAFAGTDRTATAKTGLGVKSEGQLLVSGSNGYILVPSPWWLTRYVEIHYEDCYRIEEYNYPFDGGGLCYELTAFAERIAGKAATGGLTPEESIWMARQMEQFLAQRNLPAPQSVQATEPMRIWGHRGCCLRYPENTLPAFEAAAKLDGITGIELDVQLTADEELVVIHDEKLDRTTTGTGPVKDVTLNELKQLHITGSGRAEPYSPELTVPTLREVFDLMRPYCVERGILINIELKNSNIRYEGMEQKVLKLVKEYGLDEFIIYSSFLHESMGLIRELNPKAKIGTLAVGIHDCMLGAKKYHADALHPCVAGLDINCDAVRTGGWETMPVRAWNGEEPFYGQDRPLRETHMTKYARLGVTDLITNVPELYLKG